MFPLMIMFDFTLFQQTNHLYGPSSSIPCFSGSNIYMHNFESIDLHI